MSGQAVGVGGLGSAVLAVNWTAVGAIATVVYTIVTGAAVLIAALGYRSSKRADEIAQQIRRQAEEDAKWRQIRLVQTGGYSIDGVEVRNASADPVYDVQLYFAYHRSDDATESPDDGFWLVLGEVPGHSTKGETFSALRAKWAEKDQSGGASIPTWVDEGFVTGVEVTDVNGRRWSKSRPNVRFVRWPGEMKLEGFQDLSNVRWVEVRIHD